MNQLPDWATHIAHHLTKKITVPCSWHPKIKTYIPQDPNSVKVGSGITLFKKGYWRFEEVQS